MGSPRIYRYGIAMAIAVVAALIVGYLVGVATTPPAEPSTEPESSETAQVWTCSMHPEIRQPGPGKCPKCGMDLIPVTSGDGAAGDRPRTFETSESAKALMGIATSPVERRFVEARIRMVGKVDYDETRLAYITAWVPGRIERLYADYTGVTVKTGDHMVDLYSPDLLAAKDELYRATKALERLPSGAPASVRESAGTTLKAVRSKLSRWGMTDAQIAKAESQGSTNDRITIYAPAGGTVIKREGQEGMYVDTGQRIYTIADLNKVWVKLDAYESDLAWLHFGQAVTFTTEAYPGETFEGKIAFIDPVLDPATRTVKVRVNVPNEDGRLKPEMFVRATVRSRVATGGRVADPELADKWISPMHPEIVKDGPGTCDVCGMDLVRASELGYVSAEATDADMPLVIPATAPLITGARAVVYVEAKDTEKPTFEGREVVLGPRAGDYYLVESGLEEGERVVTNGNFKIDSALQILARPSMMTPEELVDPHAGHDHDVTGEPGPTAALPDIPAAFQSQLGELFNAYLALHKALADDDTDGSAQASGALSEAVEAIDMALLAGDPHMVWMDHLESLRENIEAVTAADDIEAIRAAYYPLSMQLMATLRTFGLPDDTVAYETYCPMAFDGDGGTWLQSGKEVLNPYYGAMMLNCGEIVGPLATSMEGSGHE